jgi:hypothetical protein
MTESHVLTGLIAKRAEIAGQIEHTQDQLRQPVVGLDHTDACYNEKHSSRRVFSPLQDDENQYK